MKHTSIIFTIFCALWLTQANAETALGGNLDGLLDYAREHNPELVATRHEADAAQQRGESAEALDDPLLRIEPMDVSNGNPATKFTLMQRLPWFGKRDLQREVAVAQASQADGQAAASWSDLASRIKATYAMHYYAVGSERLAQQTLELLDGMEQIAQTRYANGIGQQQDVIRAQVEKTMLHGELIALQNERHHSHARLNTLLSRHANAPLAEPVQLRVIPASAKLDERALLERLRERNPQLRIADAGIQSSEKSRELAYADRYPDFTLGVAPTRSGGAVKSWDLMLELNIPLQQSARRSREREAAAMFSASTARKEVLLNQVESDLSENLSALEAARRTETLIATRLLPQVELTYQSALAGYQNGKVDFAMLVEAQKQILKARQQLLQTQTDMQLRLADIEKLLGDEL